MKQDIEAQKCVITVFRRKLKEMAAAPLKSEVKKSSTKKRGK